MKEVRSWLVSGTLVAVVLAWPSALGSNGQSPLVGPPPGMPRVASTTATRGPGDRHGRIDGSMPRRVGRP